MAGQKRRRADSTVEDDTRPPPQVFRSPGLVCDTRLTVCDQEFHVHSVILKLYSNYFRKFLDCPERHPPAVAQTGSAFKYDYIAVVDEDNIWGLEPVASAQADKLLECLPENDLDLPAFRKLLCAMYHRPYRLESFQMLEVLVDLADFYCALPIVSATLTAALLGTPIFQSPDVSMTGSYNVWEIQGPVMLVLAKKLRHALLFREAFVHVVSNWQGNVHGEHYVYDKESNATSPFPDDKELLRLVYQGYSQVCSKLLKVNQHLFKLIVEDDNFETIIRDMGEDIRSDTNPTTEASYFRCLKDNLKALEPDSDYPPLRKALDDLLQKNLLLDRSSFGAGQGPYEGFLCAEISDEEMPWDPSEIDW
ncbi:hypothetical protein BP6252_08623 [Coleophoma cylindrospora]|uniref:BTB domain-containing protein n=1 Tax=Coleophoma cylindrospora TaxID=1849047 RepID=A0A3D8R6D9_9HELO|nr:hypothetical protein BP6252_08623 [Coleophoma cylindrospora]